MSSVTAQSAPGADTNRGGAVIGIAWFECALAIIIVAIRLWARILIKNVGIDDWSMLVTLAIFIIWSAVVTHYANLGGFRHIYYLELDGIDTEKITYYNYIIQFITTFSYAPAKLSVACLVMRIIGTGNSTQGSFCWRKWLIYGTIALVWVSTIINCIMTYAQCSPARALWDKSITGKCWNPEVEPHFAYFSSSVNIFCDVMLAFIPASVIWTLQLDKKKRINLCIILGLGIIAAICGIVKTTYLPSLGAHADITWNTYNLIVWAGSELFVIIFCGCIPAVKPLWDRAVGNKTYLSAPYRHDRKDSSASSRWMRSASSDSGQKDIKLDTSETALPINLPQVPHLGPGIAACYEIDVTSQKGSMHDEPGSIV